MVLRRLVVALAVVAGVQAATAQEGDVAKSTAPPVLQVRLLDEIPNYAEVLGHQWRDGVPDDVLRMESGTDNFGLLGDQSLQPTSLQECVALAVANNTDLQIQRLGPLSARVGVRQARAVFDPVGTSEISKVRDVSPASSISEFTSGSGDSLLNQDFNAKVGVAKTLLSGGQLAVAWVNDRIVTNPSVANQLIPRYVSTLGLSLNQPLLRDFGWRYSLLLVEVAQNTEEAAYYLYEAALASLIARVELGYWLLVTAVQQVEVTEQGLSLAQELLRQNEGKFNVGTLPQTAVLEAKAEVAQREADIIRAKRARDNARDGLRALINAKNPDALSLRMIDPSDKPSVLPYRVDLENSLRAALQQRPELVAARLDVHGRGLLRKTAENQLLPKLNFVGSIGVNGLSGHATAVDPNSPAYAVPNPAVVGGYDRALGLLVDGRYYDYSAGVTIEVPLTNATAKANYAQANIDLDQSRLGLQKLQESVTLEVKQAVNNLEADLKNIDATRIARELAEENLRNQKARYDVGLGTTKDLLDYQNRLTQARTEEVLALTKYNSDLAEMRRVEGTILRERNVVVEREMPEKAPWWARF